MKRLVLGLIIGLLVGTAGTALAASETVQVTLQKFVFKVNGIEKQLNADPLVYQGTTYLPVREVANMLGYDVTYRADSKTIELTSTRNETPSIERGDTVPSELITEEWIGLRTLAEQYGLTVRQASPQGSVFRVAQGESIWFDITYDKKGGAYATTPDGTPVKIMTENGVTKINVEDLRNLGLIQNQN